MAKDVVPPIIILGMHRSGTSLVAGLLHSVGVCMGTEFLPADELNPTGYYEDTEFLYINKGILENSGGSWFSPPTLSKILDGSKKFHAVIKKTIERKAIESNGQPWGWKDPRMCLVSWVYAQAVPNAKYLIVIRNRQDMIRSLQKAHGNKADWSALSDLYYHQIDKFLSRVTNDFLVVNFEELVYMKYFKTSIGGLLEFVGVPPKRVKTAVKFIKFR